MADASEAKALAGIGTTIDFAGERLEIRPLRFGQLLDILAIAEKLVATLSDRSNGAFDEDDLSFFVRLIGKHKREVPQVLAIAIKRDAAFIEEAALDEIVDLFAEVYEVNRSFFDQHLAPALQRGKGRLGLRSPGAGQTPPST